MITSACTGSVSATNHANTLCGVVCDVSGKRSICTYVKHMRGRAGPGWARFCQLTSHVVSYFLSRGHPVANYFLSIIDHVVDASNVF